MKNVILALVLIVLASPLYAEEAYAVNVGIYQDGNLIGSPVSRAAGSSDFSERRKMLVKAYGRSRWRKGCSVDYQSGS